MADLKLPENFDIQKQKERFGELTEELQDPSIMSDQDNYISVTKEYNDLKEVIEVWDKLSSTLTKHSQSQELLVDDDFKEIAEEEMVLLEGQYQRYLDKFTELTLPKLKNDNNKAIMEIRSGTGGVEAALFAEEIMRMYVRYANNIKTPVEMVSTTYQTEGGIKEAILELNAPGSFGTFRFESGVHRVQRVPVTESGGRIHTSAISVALLPQISRSEIEIKDSDLKIEVFRSSGPGGQSVNTTDSAVRITHIPSGITVSCQDGKSQHKNKDKAMGILASKLYQLQAEEEAQAAQEIRNAAVKSGDRSAKIRTYNFQQGRVTDHRTKDSWFDLPNILEGNLAEVVPTVNKKIRMSLID